MRKISVTIEQLYTYLIYKATRLKIVELKSLNQTFSAVCHNPYTFYQANIMDRAIILTLKI